VRKGRSPSRKSCFRRGQEFRSWSVFLVDDRQLERQEIDYSNYRRKGLSNPLHGMSGYVR